MEINFTPWRMEYIKSDKKEEGCIFCKAFVESPSFENLVVKILGRSAILLNRYPYNNGHLLVVPYSHTSALSSLCEEEIRDLHCALVLCEKALKEIYNPHGINIGMNIGEAAGAGIVDHIHYHILPRWRGDTNFVTVIGNLRTIPEALKDTYDSLKRYFEEFKEGNFSK